ncbi:MAG: methyltransferase domain-containing protein, partial [Acidobacteria bacterium]|nr:methyltransferase domain-containing protein [Acidobacteriota bacterium]
VAAGHRVVATDASPAMVALARETVPGAESVRRLTLPDDPLPSADAIVSVGHVLSYLPDVPSVARALRAIAAALRPGGVVAVDLLDRAYRAARAGKQPMAAFSADWAVFVAFASPDPETWVRDITTFVRNVDGTYQRDDERHVNVLVDAAEVASRLATAGLEDVEVARGFDGRQEMEEGLVAIIGVRRHAAETGRGFEPRAVTNSS